MNARLFAAAALTAGLFAVLPARGALVISEVVYNEVGSDPLGEWIEIYNNGDATIDLSNYKIGDEESSTGTGVGEAIHQFPAGASIAPGAVQIVAVSAARFFQVYGVNPTYEVTLTDGSVPDMLPYATWDSDGGTFNMSNSSDQALVIDGADALVDAMSWGGTFAFNPALADAEGDGQSYERINALVDTDTAADWQLGPTNTDAAKRSTPFEVSVPEPASLGLIGLAGGLLVGRRRRGA